MNIDRTVKIQIRKTAEILEGVIESPEIYSLEAEEIKTLEKAKSILEKLGR